MFLLPFFAVNADAQIFSVAHDTVCFTAPLGDSSVFDSIYTTGSPISVKWNVEPFRSDFPSDWISNTSGGSTAFCDNSYCYGSGIDISGTVETTTYAAPGGPFHMQINLTGATTRTGTYYMTVKFNSGSENAYETFIVTYPNTSVPMVQNADEILLYPNPATTSVNVVYDQSLEIKNVAIYNIIGKLMSIYKVSGNSANLNTENLNAGIYFIRLMNAQGEVVAVRKFTKQ